VIIEQVWVGKERLDLRLPANLPPGARAFRFQFTALSLAAPERIRFRYKLDGIDRDWVDADTRRTAFYHEIPPGDHRFHVIACNSDGVWNEAGAVFAFSLAPHFYQTLWCYGLCAIAVAAAGWGFHRHRMKRAHDRFSLVLAERNRIARELHDTLAQGFAGIGFQLEARRNPPEGCARPGQAAPGSGVEHGAAQPDRSAPFGHEPALGRFGEWRPGQRSGGDGAADDRGPASGTGVNNARDARGTAAPD
jgi:hypothetical protein